MATSAFYKSFAHRLKSRLHFMFRKHLLATNLIISTTLCATGDVLQQHYEQHLSSSKSSTNTPTFNYTRSCHMWIAGGSVGFLCHHWYSLLDGHLPGRSLRIVLIKTCLDQALASPVIITVFCLTLALLKKKSLVEFKKEFKDKFWRLYLAELMLWSPAALINFALLPNRFRVLYDNSILLVYNVYASSVVHEKVERKNE